MKLLRRPNRLATNLIFGRGHATGCCITYLPTEGAKVTRKYRNIQVLFETKSLHPPQPASGCIDNHVADHRFAGQGENAADCHLHTSGARTWGFVSALTTYKYPYSGSADSGKFNCNNRGIYQVPRGLRPTVHRPARHGQLKSLSCSRKAEADVYERLSSDFRSPCPGNTWVIATCP